MKAKGVLLPVLAGACALLLAAPLAAAATVGQLEATAPVTLQGGFTTASERLDFALLAGDTARTTTAELSGPALNVLVREESRCSAQYPVDPCGFGSEPGDGERTLHLTDFHVTVTDARRGFVLLGRKDADFDADVGPRPIVVDGDAAAMDVFSADREVVPPGAKPVDYGPQQRIVRGTPYLVAKDGANLAGDGGAWLWVWNATVTLSGVGENGEPYRETLRTGEYTTNEVPGATMRHLRWLSLTFTADELAIETTAPLYLHGSDLRIDPAIALFESATGTVTGPDGDRALAAEPLRLEDPLTLVATGVRARNDAVLLTFDVVNPGAPVTLGGVLADASPLGGGAAATALGLGAMGTLGALAYYWPRFRFAATAFVLPLYSRIERSDVLQHEKREEIYRLIQENPGIHAHAIGTEVEVGWGTTVYHLNMLQQHGLIVAKKSGRYKRFFSAGSGIGNRKEAVGLLRNETASRIGQFVLGHPGSSQKELSAALDLQPSLITWHMNRLEAADLVKKVKDGRMVRYYAGPAWKDLQEHVGAGMPGDGAPASATFTTEAET